MSDGAAVAGGDFGTTFRRFMEQTLAQAPREEPYFLARLTEHFGTAPGALPIVTETVPTHNHANVQLALDHYLEGPGRTSTLLGVVSEQKRFGMGLSDLTAPTRPGAYGGSSVARPGPVDYVNIAVGPTERLACLQFGVYLVTDGAQALAVLVRGPDRRYGNNDLSIDVMAPTRGEAERFLATIRDSMRQRNVYRGRVVSLSATQMGALQVAFHDLPAVAREDIVLPAGTLERVERQTIRFAQVRGRLAAAGRHLKRGILLWGPPGTGKTLTAMHLASRMPERTTLVLTGGALGLIAPSCAMARLLQPATVILEDVDLVAEERTRQGTATNAVLFELLNQMDGLGDDADILFLLTTNRPELLEPALAARPGRIDEAIEIPAPDADCRRRLLDLYGRGLELDLDDVDGVVDRTEGVSAAFIRELLRKAALIATDAETTGGTGGAGLRIGNEHLDAALAELLTEGGALTRALLGVAPLPRRPSECG